MQHCAFGDSAFSFDAWVSGRLTARRSRGRDSRPGVRRPSGLCVKCREQGAGAGRESGAGFGGGVTRSALAALLPREMSGRAVSLCPVPLTSGGAGPLVARTVGGACTRTCDPSPPEGFSRHSGRWPSAMLGRLARRTVLVLTTENEGTKLLFLRTSCLCCRQKAWASAGRVGLEPSNRVTRGVQSKSFPKTSPVADARPGGGGVRRRLGLI